MFPAYCSTWGLAGWLMMLGVWAAVVALVVWGVTRLFPDRTGTPPPPAPVDRTRAEVPPQPVGTSRGH